VNTYSNKQGLHPAGLRQEYGLGFVVSLATHLALIASLGFSIQTTTTPVHLPSASGGDIVQAKMIDERAIVAEMKRLEVQESQKKQEENRKLEVLNQKAQAAIQLREKEQAKMAKLKQELEKAKQEAQSRIHEIRAAREKERKELEALKQAKEKESKRLAALADRRQEEQDRAAQMRLEREREEHQKAKSVGARQKVDEDKKAAALGAHEAAQLAAHDSEGAELLESEVERYKGMIKTRINQSWVRPPGLPAGLKCTLEIQTLPDGSVVSVKVTKPSENMAFNQSAEMAVHRATPLPLPPSEMMDRFRSFEMIFAPDGLSL